jgi:hypothetical protein
MHIERDETGQYDEMGMDVYFVKDGARVVGTITHAPRSTERKFVCWVGGNEIAACQTLDEAVAAHQKHHHDTLTKTDVRGIAPDATGFLSSEDYVRALRDDWR